MKPPRPEVAVHLGEGGRRRPDGVRTVEWGWPMDHTNDTEAARHMNLKNAVRHREHRGKPELHRDLRSLSRKADVHPVGEFVHLMIDFVNGAL